MCEIKTYNDESVDMNSGGIVLNGRGFLPEGSPANDPGPELRYIAPGSGTFKNVNLKGSSKNPTIMHFPMTDLINTSNSLLSEDEVRKAYKEDTLKRFN